MKSSKITTKSSKPSLRYTEPAFPHSSRKEHIHRDEEIRFFLEGSGFFDVRDSSDEWLRIHAFAGDLIVLPAGIYHRYSPDEKNYSKVSYSCSFHEEI